MMCAWMDGFYTMVELFIYFLAISQNLDIVIIYHYTVHTVHSMFPPILSYLFITCTYLLVFPVAVIQKSQKKDIAQKYIFILSIFIEMTI